MPNTIKKLHKPKKFEAGKPHALELSPDLHATIQSGMSPDRVRLLTGREILDVRVGDEHGRGHGGHGGMDMLERLNAAVASDEKYVLEV